MRRFVKTTTSFVTLSHCFHASAGPSKQFKPYPGRACLLPSSLTTPLVYPHSCRYRVTGLTTGLVPPGPPPFGQPPGVRQNASFASPFPKRRRIDPQGAQTDIPLPAMVNLVARTPFKSTDHWGSVQDGRKSAELEAQHPANGRSANRSEYEIWRRLAVPPKTAA
jgi:hypothetical protein